MTEAEVLVLVKADLGILNPDNNTETFLASLITTSIKEIERVGITLSSPYEVEDATLISMYACYLYRKRNTDEGLPRMIKARISNRLMSERMQE